MLPGACAELTLLYLLYCRGRATACWRGTGRPGLPVRQAASAPRRSMSYLSSWPRGTADLELKAVSILLNTSVWFCTFSAVATAIVIDPGGVRLVSQDNCIIYTASEKGTFWFTAGGGRRALNKTCTKLSPGCDRDRDRRCSSREPSFLRLCVLASRPPPCSPPCAVRYTSAVWRSGHRNQRHRREKYPLLLNFPQVSYNCYSQTFPSTNIPWVLVL